MLVGGGILSCLVALSPVASGDGSKSPSAEDARDPSLPRYRLADVRTHDASSPNPWVTNDDKVYDITDWVSAHPGGDVILRAAGQSIDPYWAMFVIHTQAHVLDILNGYLIGYIDSLDLVDGLPPKYAIQDPFEQDPVRHPSLKRHTAKPCNAEPPNQELDGDFITPNELFYVRNHMWVPVVDDDAVDKHPLTIELPHGEEKTYTLEELKKRFKTHRVTAVLQCSGNRRSDMTRNAGKTTGLQWGVGAISNAQWEGVRLMDVLADAGLRVADARTHTALDPKQDEDEDLPDPNTHHVQFTGMETYGSSISLAAALDPRNDVLLAFGMNGEPLPRDHGFPLRAVVPGQVAARSVKWLNRIVISDEESPSQYQRRDYKCFGPNERKPDWDKAPAIQELPITSAITKVLVGQCVRDGGAPWLKKPVAEQPQKEPIAVQGYAISGGGREVTRIDVSLDGGETWDQAELLSEPYTGNKAWTWKRWRYVGSLPQPAVPARGQKGARACTTVVVKATDNTYNTQPQTHKSIFNDKGNLANAWHRVRVCPSCMTSQTGDKKVVWRTGETFGCGFQQEKGDAELEKTSGQ